MIQKMNIKTKLFNYLKQDEFKELMNELKKKYVNYGSCLGKITLIPKNEAEVLKLSGFLSKSIRLNEKNIIKITDIQKCLDDSCYEGFTVNDLVFMIYPNIKSNKEIKNETNIYINNKMDEYKKLYEKSHISNLFINNDMLKKIRHLIIHDELLLDNILKSLNQLPIYDDDYLFLPIFSSNMTGNPHYYDIDTHNSNTLINFICHLFNYKTVLERKDKITILEKVGILIDTVSNFVITYNLYGNKLLDSFYNDLTPLTLSLANIYKMDTIKAVNNKVLIIENPSFISRVIDKEIDYSVIVSSGNSNLVVYKLLDKIDADIYLNGDFDPEGLLIAEKFKARYPQLKFIGYNEEEYYNGISKNEINNIRLKKLEHITDKELFVIKDLLLKNKLSSYQEANYDRVISIMNEKNI